MHMNLPASMLLLVLGLSPAMAQAPKNPPPASKPGLDLPGMNRQVSPGDDFYGFANGSWMERATIPADRGTIGIGMEVDARTTKRIERLIRGAAASRPKPGSDARKVADLFASYMDEATIEARGLEPLRPALARIAAIGDRKALAAALGGTVRADVDVLNATSLVTRNFLGLWVAQDLNDPSRYRPFLLQGGLGMPDRDYYLASGPRSEAIRARYRTHIATVLQLSGFSDAGSLAQKVFDLETKMAQVHASRQDTGDIKKGNNPWSRADFDKKAPGLDWQAFFGAVGLSAQQEFTVWQPGAVTGLSALAATEPLDTWKAYLAYQTVDQVSGMLPKAFVAERFAFFSQTLQGVPQMRPRVDRGVNLTSAVLGEAVGKLYVTKHFPADHKARVQAMVTHLLQAFGQRIDQLAWMAPETKAKAKAKLAVMKVGVGYPDRWTDYSSLNIDPKDLVGNLDRASRFNLAQQLAKLGKPVDRSEWVMTPQVVNAVNLPAMNAMNFPAGMLQPPYFDPRQPDAMNYGAIGAIIGHEISHSFDDQGALFDATGRLNNWWTPEDLAHFEASAAKLVAQYNGYKPFPDAAVNGQLTLGENIADVAGLAAAYDAYILALKGKPAPKVQGFTGPQQFFLAYAQSWREKNRESVLRQQLLMDGHTPAEYRTYTVRNQDAWYEAFGVKPGQKLHLEPKDRVKIW